jgi:hypothetical protein
MTALIPELAVVTTGVGAAMIRLGQGLLQPRKAPSRCPSCGRLIEGPLCRHCTGNTR